MRGLSFVEITAVLFAGMAGIASAIQAYVSFETRGEVARAIVFAERIDACAGVMVAIEPFVAKARPEARKLVEGGDPGGRYSLPGLYYRTSSGSPAFDAAHDPLVDRWRIAYAAFSIVLPEEVRARGAYFDRVIVDDLPAGAFMSQAEMLDWLETLDREAAALTADCRSLLETPPAAALLALE